MAAAPALAASARWRRPWYRLNGPARVGGVDLARGLAVLGMFAAHLYAMPALDPTEPATWGGIVDGRSSILFATLAGVSMGLVTGGSRIVADTALSVARARLAVRAVLLWAIGVALMATGVPVYVILPAYGILFLIALPFLGLGAGVLWTLAAATAVVMPFVQVALNALPAWETPVGGDVALLIGWHYPFPVWIAFVLAGLAAARSDLARVRTQVLLVAVGAALAAIGYGLAAAVPAVGDGFWPTVWTAEPHSTGLLEVIGSGGFALATIGLCLLACRTVITWIVLPLRAVGSMPLTAYAGQLIAWAIIAAVVLGDTGDLTGFRALDPFPAFAVAALVGCTVWALTLGRGPFEWALDRVARMVAPVTMFDRRR